MQIDKYVQPFLVISLVFFLFSLFFFTIPEKNAEFVKTCLTAIISFISGSSLALALVRANNNDDEDKKRK